MRTYDWIGLGLSLAVEVALVAFVIVQVRWYRADVRHFAVATRMLVEPIDRP